MSPFFISLQKIRHLLQNVLLFGGFGGWFFIWGTLFYEPWLRPHNHLSPFFSFSHREEILNLWFLAMPLFFFYGFCLFALFSLAYHLVNSCLPVNHRYLRKLSEYPLLQYVLPPLTQISRSSLVAALGAFGLLGLYGLCAFNDFLRSIFLPLFQVYIHSIILMFNLEGESTIALGLESFGWVFAGSYFLGFILVYFIQREFKLRQSL